MNLKLIIKTVTRIFLCYLFISTSGVQANLVILQYHHVAENTPAVTSIKPNQFVAHLNFLAANNFNVIDLPSAMQAINKGLQLPNNSVAITFDDGYANLLNTALPELYKRKWPFTIFVNPGLINYNTHLYLSWDDLNKIADNGGTIANHGWLHDYWIRPSSEHTKTSWREQVQQQILDAEQAIKKHIGHDFKYVAYPYGEYDLALVSWLKKQGFTAFGQHSGAVGPETHQQIIPRFPANGIYADLTTLSAKLYSLAMPVKQVIPTDPQVDSSSTILGALNENPPKLQLEFVSTSDFKLSQLACYVSGQTEQANITHVSESIVEVVAKQSLGKGRSRYNCTVPSRSKPGQHYWYSQYWFNVQGLIGD
ncbi:polysaccharide deacetylase family protein [Algibacillus agarilyticus]|uniref:polysaccharide deacetylase family protein n=1 Tax=Algibacillus agarilyticus TaxID=2234133 RepID=UPI000DD0A137|nr:polysaccharide deacetylase family protein [Algibacillus agarilyticus]